MRDAVIKSEPLDTQGAVVPQLHQRLRELIVRGDLPPGKRLSETEVARAFSVSRQPVREAFIRLVDDGLIEVRPQRGSYVCKISISRVLDARFMREAVEADIVRLIAGSANNATVQKLRASITAQREAAHDGYAFLALDDRFHMALAEAVDKTDVWRILTVMKIQMDRVRHILSKENTIQRSIEQHSAIVDAIERNDPDAAEAAMRQHLRQILADLDEINSEDARYFDDETQ